MIDWPPIVTVNARGAVHRFATRSRWVCITPVSTVATTTLRVGTLDSWFIQLAGSFSLELGLPAGWTICEEQIDRNLRDEAIEHAFPAENDLCAGGPDRPFKVGPQALSRGAYMYELWNNPLHGKSPPEPAGAVTVVAARQVRR